MCAVPTPKDAVVAWNLPLAAAGQRLDRYLSEQVSAQAAPEPLHGLSRARLQQLIEEGRVLCDNRPARSSQRLRGGERVQVAVPRPVPATIAPQAMTLDVLYEDADLIAIAKPAGLTVHPGAGRTSGTLVNGLLAHCGDLSGIGGVERPGIVHRLDRGTSGVIVVAKHDRAHVALARQFAARQVVKRYVAFVLGVPRPPRRTLETLFARHPTARQRFSSKVQHGKVAITSFEVAAMGGGVARLDVLLGTGRTHQIRVHLADIGHAVVGDKIYGGRRFERIVDASLREVAAQLTYQALHAASLELAHPTTGAHLRFAAPLPSALVALDEAMRRAGACRQA